MNKTPKEKPCRLYLRVSPSEKKKITDIAKCCGIPVAEYLRKRALGYAVKAAVPDAFYDLYGKLCELCNVDDLLLPTTQTALLELIDRIHSELLLPGKENLKLWQPQDSGLSNPD